MTRLVASAGSAGGGILALTITMELSGAAETLGWLPWVTWSTLLANYQASLPGGTCLQSSPLTLSLLGGAHCPGGDHPLPGRPGTQGLEAVPGRGLRSHRHGRHRLVFRPRVSEVAHC